MKKLNLLYIILIIIVIFIISIIIYRKSSEKYESFFFSFPTLSSFPSFTSFPTLSQNTLNTPGLPSFLNTNQPYKTFNPSTQTPYSQNISLGPTLKAPVYNLQTPYPNQTIVSKSSNITGLWHFNSNINDYGIINIVYNKNKKLWNIYKINIKDRKKSLPKNTYIKIENQKMVLKIDSLRQTFILDLKDNKMVSLPLKSSKEIYIFKRV